MAAAVDHATTLDEPSPAKDGHARCAVARCAEIVSGKWTLLVVRDLALGPRSYSDLESSLAGISPRTLCERLKLLATEGLVTRTRIKGLPPRTEYALTERGELLLPVLETMRRAGAALLEAPHVEPDAAGDFCCDE